MPKLAASINPEKGLVVPPAPRDENDAQPILYREGCFVVHADLRGATWGYCVTAPCGFTLGRYRLKTDARKAAGVLAPMVADANANTLDRMFGSETKAREAYNAARPFFGWSKGS